MPRRFISGAAAGRVRHRLQPAPEAQPAAAASAMPLTVDAIMRGPALVGYPPCDLRWSGDSRELYFEWRTPGEDEAATWVVGRDGGRHGDSPTTSDAWRRWPTAGGTAAARASSASIAATSSSSTPSARRRIELTRTSATEIGAALGSRRHHVTFVRDNQVFVVPVDDGGRRRAGAARRRGGRPAPPSSPTASARPARKSSS